MMEWVIKSVDGFLAGYVNAVEIKWPNGNNPSRLGRKGNLSSWLIDYWLGRCWEDLVATVSGSE